MEKEKKKERKRKKTLQTNVTNTFFSWKSFMYTSDWLCNFKRRISHCKRREMWCYRDRHFLICTYGYVKLVYVQIVWVDPWLFTKKKNKNSDKEKQGLWKAHCHTAMYMYNLLKRPLML
jgi:hypothetical protein